MVDTVDVDEAPATATDNPPAGINFSLTTDLSLMTTTTPLAVAATVCLPITGVLSGREPILFHYTADTWNEIGRDTATRAEFVCGETTTFSPFAVGYALPPEFGVPIDNQTYTVGIFKSVTLPAATNGDGDLTYTLTPTASIPDELTFDAVERTLAGMPTRASAAVALTYTVTDSATPPATTFLTFTVTVVDMSEMDNDLTTRLNEQILTRASQAMTASTLEAVARRVDAAAGGIASRAGGAGTTPALAYQFGGQSSLNGLLKSHGKAMLEDNMEYERLFDGASFVVPLSAAEGGTGGGKSGAGALSLWGSSNFINLGSDKDELDWDGQVVSIQCWCG